MRRYDMQKIRFPFKRGYIFTLILCLISAFMFIGLSSAADANQVNIAIPRIEGVNFYRVLGDTQTKINIFSDTKNISFSETETLHLRAQIDSEQYYSEATFSLTGLLAFDSEPVFENGYWNLKIKKSESGNWSEANSLQVSLKEKQDMFLEFLNSDGVEFFSKDGSEALGGTLENVKETESFEFVVKVDTKKVTVTNTDDFAVSAGRNTCTLQYVSNVSGIYTYNAKIESVIDSAHIEAAELINLTMQEIQGVSYYSNEACSNRINNNSSKVFARGAKFEFYALIDSRVPLNAAEEGNIKFYFGSNEIVTEYKGGKKYKITLSDIKINASITAEGLYKIWFPPKALGITYTDAFGEMDNNYRTVGLNAVYTFNAQLENSIFGGNDGVEFSISSSAINISSTKTSTNPPTYGITLNNIESDGEVQMNYLTAGFKSYTGVKYYQTNASNQLQEISADRYFPIKKSENFVFFIGFDTTEIEVGDNLRSIDVKAGKNGVDTALADTYKRENEKIFRVNVKGIEESYILEIPGLLTLDLSHNVEDGSLSFWNVTDYTGIPETEITDAKLKKTVLKGSEYTCIARLKKDEVFNSASSGFDGNQGTMGTLKFELGEGNPTKTDKFYYKDEADNETYVCYNVTGTINNSGKVDLYDAYTVEFEDTGAELGFTYNNQGKTKIKGYDDCSFGITKGNNPSPEFLVNGNTPNNKFVVNNTGDTYTIENISEDTIITPVTKEISYLPSGQGYTITPNAGTPISNSDGSKTIKVAKGLKLSFDIKLNNSILNLNQDQVRNMAFRCGSNDVDVKSRPNYSATGWLTFTVEVACAQDGTLTVGKSILFPEIYNVNFYECKNSGSTYSLGEQIQGGSQRGFMAGDSFMFFVEIDNSIALPNSLPYDLFSLAGNSMTYQSTIKPSNGNADKTYAYYKVEHVVLDSSLVSNYLFTVDLPVLNNIYYYKERNATSGDFSGQILDNKFTVYKNQTPKYQFYVHFDGAGTKGTISAGPELTINQDTSGTDFTVVTVASISASSSIKITDWDIGRVSVEMPSIEKCIKTIQYSANSGEYKDGGGWVIDMNYGDDLKLKISFKADAEGYTNLYKTLYSRIKVKVYKMADSGSGENKNKVLLKTLSIKNLDKDANEFVAPNIEYETESYKPYCDVTLEIEGIKEDIYDVNIVSGDNTFLDEFVDISSIIKINKIENETGKKVDDVEVPVPFSVFRNGYLIKSIRYGEELRFNYSFTNTANAEGIKYNLSEVTFKIDPYEGDSGELNADEDNIYSAVIKTNSEITLSGIKGNQYEINIPATPSVTVKYVINSETFPSENLISTAENNKISVAHGQKLLMKISSNDATKRYIRKVTATNTTYDSEPEILYEALAKENEVKVSIERVLGNTDLSIEVSKLEYEVLISLRETDENNKETYFYPSVDKLYIYDNNNMGASLNISTDSDSAGDAGNTGDSKPNYLRHVMETGKEFDFKISLDYKYNKSNIVVSYKAVDSGEFGSSSMLHPEKGVYSLKIDRSYRIFIDNVKKNVYDIEFPQMSEEINFHRVNINTEGKEEVYPLPMNGIQKFEHGETLQFVAKINAGYELAGDSVKANGEPLRLKNGKYELANISSDIKITADTLDKIEYTITFPTTINGVSFIDALGSNLTSTKKKFGENLAFKVMLDAQHNQSINNIRVYAIKADTVWESPSYNPAADSTAIPLVMDGASNYNLTSVSRDSVIIVTGVEQNKYFIDLPLSEEGISFYVPVKNESDELEQVEVTEENEKQVSVCLQGENFMFSVVAKAGYDISQMNLTATVTGSTLENSVEKLATGYIIQEVNYDYTVRVSNIKDKYHTVIINGENMECRINPNSSETIKAGSVQYGVGELRFYVTPSEGYVFDETGLTALATPLDRAKIEVPQLREDGNLDGPVVISEVTGDFSLKLGGVHAQTFTVTLPIDTEGISFMYVGNESSGGNSDSFELGRTNTVEIGKDFKFYISPDAGYDISNISVSIGPGEYIYPLEGVYTVTNVRKDTTVQVENVGYAKYNIKIRGDNLTFYEPNGLFPQSDFTVGYMESTEFRVVANTGYEIDLQNGIYFSVGGKAIDIDGKDQSKVCIDRTDRESVFKIWNVTEDTSINVSGAKKQIYTLSFPTDVNGATLRTPLGEDIQAEEKVEYLSNFDFEIIPDRGYNADSVNITIYPPENGIIKVINGGYSIQGVTGDLSISISDVKPNEHTVYYKGVGADFYNKEGMLIQSASTLFGGDNVFSISKTEGYDLLNGYDISITNDSGAVATIHFPAAAEEDAANAQKSAKLPDGTLISESARFTYTISNIQGDLVVTIENVGKTIHDINFPTSVVGIKFTNEKDEPITSAKIDNGLDFVFKIVAEEGYDISNIVVTANLQPIDLIDQKYTLKNITEDINIDVSGVVSTRVYVSLKYVPGVNYVDTKDVPLSTLDRIPVSHGDSYSFKIVLDEAYSKTKDKMQVSVSPQASNLSFERGIYTVSNITEDMEVTVTGVEINTYNVNLTEATGVKYKDQFGTSEIDGAQVVNYGEDFRFIVEPDEGYNLSDIEVSVKGSTGQRVALTPVDNIYTVPNVVMDYTVVVEKAKKEVYTVEIRLPEGVTLVDAQGRDMETRQSVDHGSDLPFRLSIATAYDKSVPVVTVKGRTGEVKPENNLYTVRSISGDTIVEVTNITKNTYKVKFQAIEGVIYRTEKNKDFSGYLEVEYGGTLNFKIAMKDEYDASQIMVLLDGDKVLAENGGIYQILSISSDCEVSVKYSEKNVEEYVIEMIDALPNKITSRQQADQVVTVSRAFNSLPEERKILVTNLSKLKILQTQTADVHHESNDVEVSGGLDWNIKVVVTPLDGNAASVDALNKEMKRKVIISHYEISLIDSLTGAKYEPAENTAVSVVVPCDIPKGYMNTVIVHKKASGSIEYLDVLISNGYAKFDTTSFSVFGLAAKPIPNYVEEANNITVSFGGLTDNEEEVKKNIAQSLPSIMEADAEEKLSTNNGVINNGKSGNIVDDTNGNFLNKILNWIVTHELLITVIMISLFSIWIFIIVGREKKKNS